MGDLFPDRKKSMCDKSLLRVREPEAVAMEIAATEKAVYELVANARHFLEQSRQMGLVRRLVYRTIAVAHPNLPEYPRKEFHIPSICWAEYEGKKRTDITDWAKIAVYLDKANASYDERLLHIRVHLTMRQFHSEGRRLYEILKTDYALVQEIQQMSESQNIPVAAICLPYL